MKILTIAHIPDSLAQQWLQHLRNFDVAHPGCHFEVAAETGMSLGETIEAMIIDPELSFKVIRSKR